MKYYQQKARIEYIQTKAKSKATGTPSQLAEKLDISKSTLERTIKEMRENNIPIIYSRIRSTYIILT
jgi:DNA-binding MarR family transcriptional regulator